MFNIAVLPRKEEDRRLPHLFPTMPSSTFSATRANGLAYSNQNCFCGKTAEIKVSNTSENPSRLFYTCKSNACRFFHWCEPLYTRQMQSMDNEVTTQEVWNVNNNKEIQTLKTEFKRMKQLMMGVVLAMGVIFFFFML